MSTNLQYIIILAVIGGAIAYLIYRYLRGRREAPKCSDCSNCGLKNRQSEDPPFPID